MDFSLTEEQKSLRDNIIKFAQHELNGAVVMRDKAQTFSPALWRKCAGIGIQGLPAEEVYGGRQRDALSTAVALEALGYGCHDGSLVFSLCAHVLACVVQLTRHGNVDQKQRYLPGLCDGALIGALAMTEPGAGSDLLAITTREIGRAHV